MNAQQKTELENKILETLAKAEKIFHTASVARKRKTTTR